MWLLVGLGNPGPKYLMTRHNAGFIILDLLAMELGERFAATKFKADAVKVKLFEQDCLLLKPMTYMNLSGQAVRQAAAFYKVPIERIIVVHDDIDLEAGKVKLRQGGGGHGGNNGVRSLIAELGSPNFSRVKIGVGRPEVGDASDWVLRPFTNDQLDDLRGRVYEEAKDRIRSLM